MVYCFWSYQHGEVIPSKATSLRSPNSSNHLLQACGMCGFVPALHASKWHMKTGHPFLGCTEQHTEYIYIYIHYISTQPPLGDPFSTRSCGCTHTESKLSSSGMQSHPEIRAGLPGGKLEKTSCGVRGYSIINSTSTR